MRKENDMELIRRTDAEIKAYADGYNDAFKRFCGCLKERPLTKAIKKMQVYVDAVNNVVMRKEGE